MRKMAVLPPVLFQTGPHSKPDDFGYQTATAQGEFTFPNAKTP